MYRVYIAFWYTWLNAIQTFVNKASKSLLWPAPHRSGINSISWLWVLSPMHSNVTISSCESDASFTPAGYETLNQIMSSLSSLHECRTSLQLHTEVQNLHITNLTWKLWSIINVKKFTHLWETSLNADWIFIIIMTYLDLSVCSWVLRETWGSSPA